MQFINHSTRNEFANNVILGVRVERRPGDGQSVRDSDGGRQHGRQQHLPRATSTCSGKIEGRTPEAQETVRPDFSPGWFAKFPTALNRDPNDFRPTPRAPFLGIGALSPLAPTDRNGAARAGKVDLGPIETR